MKQTTLNDILGDFEADSPADGRSMKDRRPVTIWLPAEIKARYDRLQNGSERAFGRKAREALVALIEAAEARTA